jgi:hypothetical protein
MDGVSKGWQVVRVDNHCIHVVPVEDSNMHILYETCYCLPTIEEVLREDQSGNGLVIVHNSFDGREAYENEESVSTSASCDRIGRKN